MNNGTGDQGTIKKLINPSNTLILDKAVALLRSYIINFRCL